MARVKLAFPDDVFVFSTKMPVRITDINGANHLGNDALISMLSEARAQFMVQMGLQEQIADGVIIVVTDLATMYQSESFYPEILRFEVGTTDLNKYGGDYVFRVTKADSGQPVALAKYGFVFLDVHQKKVVEMPDYVREQLTNATAVSQ
ncbi:thioesterase family protein [Marinobacter adhaerens]|uniref:Thioesterase family protein n=1 Tax=Marinobacter adhaerens TaxID=1033846 RepID=A0A851HW54_9GAMM|nr:thioesterase family protein [Marinobacter adhaerens]NWN91816.1 thioesterase family protein [Marinobacter adhaerens]